MEEKERYYSLIDHNGNFTLRDYETGNELTNLFDLDDLLNQQDARIKELEKENQKANIKNYLTDYYLVEKENQQLKEELKNYKSYKTDDERIKNLTDLYEKYTTENQQLKQQLHDLPKKIVEEIIEELCNCGKTFFENEPYIEICIVQGILDTILKKYGVENERK